MLLDDIVHDSARKRPDHVALILAEQSLSYAELSRRVVRATSAIAGQVMAGDRVAVLADSCVEYVDLLYAAPAAGAILTLINQRLTAGEVEYILNDAEPRILFVGHAYLDSLAELWERPGSLEAIVVLDGPPDAAAPVAGGIGYEDFLEQGERVEPPARGSDEDTAWLIYTSGTTGRPKGAMLSHRNIVSALLNALLEWRPTRDEMLLFCFPLCHVAAFIPLSYHLRQGTVVVMTRFDPGGWLAAVQRHRITHAGLAPTMLNMVLAHPDLEAADTSSLTLIAYGGSAISPTLLDRGITRFGHVFFGTFGQTEASGNVLALDIEEHRRAVEGEPHLLSAAGRCESLAVVRIVDEALRDVPVGEVGEIVIRGDQVMQGYWRNEAATRESIVDGWLRTGDLARMDGEGFVFVVDRKKDMIVTGGENVFPREVEDVIAGVEGVAEVAVIGLPDERWGEVVVAVIVTAPEGSVDGDALVAHCRTHLAGYKVPRRVEFRSELPKNAAMKILKRVLRDERTAAVGGT